MQTETITNLEGALDLVAQNAPKAQDSSQNTLKTERIRSDRPVVPIGMPSAVTPFTATGPTEAAADSSAPQTRQNPIFGALVRSDDDLVGLVAYSLYKQQKRDWLVSFARENKRQPDVNEANSYIMGEQTPRRLETYRRLAEDSLASFRAQPDSASLHRPLSLAQPAPAAPATNLAMTQPVMPRVSAPAPVQKAPRHLSPLDWFRISVVLFLVGLCIYGLFRLGIFR